MREFKLRVKILCIDSCTFGAEEMPCVKINKASNLEGFVDDIEG